MQAIEWSCKRADLAALPLGLFGASTGAAAVLVTAAERPQYVSAVVSRGGRPDLASTELERVRALTLLIVGGFDPEVLQLNREAYRLLNCEKPRATQPLRYNVYAGAKLVALLSLSLSFGASAWKFAGRDSFIGWQGLLLAGVTLLAFYIGMRWYGTEGVGLRHAVTIAFMTLTFANVFHTFNARSQTRSAFTASLFKNGWLWGPCWSVCCCRRQRFRYRFCRQSFTPSRSPRPIGA